MITYFILTYGCTLNRADSDRIIRILDSLGYKRTDTLNNADVIIFNTCGVKEATHNRVIEKLKEFKSLDKPVVVTGCMYADKKDIRKANEKIVIVDTNSPDKIPLAIGDALKGKVTEYISSNNKTIFQPIINGVTARIPLSEGCLGNCNYCFTKIARGNLRSYRIKDIKRAMEFAVNNGAKEILLTSQDTGAYGKDINTNIVELLNELISIKGNYKIRLGMANPQFILEYLDELIQVYRSPKMYKFLHIPIQSGSDNVLKDMNRQYTINDAINIIKHFRSRFNDISIATDIIVGYPTETDTDFTDTINIIRKIKFDIINISKFSPRPFTKAKQLKQLDNRIIKKRSTQISRIWRQIYFDNNQDFIGKELEIMITEKQKTFTGRTDSYRQVAILEKEENGWQDSLKLGDAIKVKITKIGGSALIGERTSKTILKETNDTNDNNN
ncbi:tRNA (N(6)-L-threonylcarbamoyladenosine(37)-C(2))-methylthiotransferase [Candidatus Micrarchaeota archaeon]|nr:tRNA (N(6)-L-threonylcarbamoyladenosine(37)-C(2))-methylthiotransferase [Candidatus Micrarchaeota archaeon]